MSNASLVTTTTTATTTTCRVDKKVKARDFASSSSAEQRTSFPAVALKNVSSSPSEESVAMAAAAEKRKKAAAAAARKRRRKIYSSRRRNNIPRPTPRSHGPNIPFSNETNVVNLSEHDGPDDDDVRLSTESASDAAWCAELGSSYSSTTNASVPTPKRLASTIQGMAEVTRRWQNEEIVAIPTECTYEACISLRTCSEITTRSNCSTTTPTEASPQDWAYRIQRARQVALNTADQPPGTLDATISPSSSSHWAPYCWVPPTADCPLLNDCFPVRYYGLRDANGRAHVAHRFNETHEVIQRMARHLWPGPVTFHVAVPDSSSSDGGMRGKTPAHAKQKSFWSNLTFCPSDPQPKTATTSTTSTMCPFLTLRCPQHPLAIKVAQGHLGVPRSKKDRTSSPCVSSSTSTDSLSVLVGFPILKTAASDEGVVSSGNAKRYCQSSADVQDKYSTPLTLSSASDDAVVANQVVSAVLDGENHSELFAVPTCEYGEPSRHEIWIHGPSRTVTLLEKTYAGDDRANTTVSTGNNGQQTLPFGGLPPSDLVSSMAMSGTRIRSALRKSIPRRPPLSKEKDQIIQAILCRWTVVEGTTTIAANRGK